MKIIDISPTISSRNGLFPGEVILQRDLQASLANGDSVTLSSMRISAHVGAHADAPSHIKEGEPSIDQLELSPYIGPCLVCETRAKEISPADCKLAIDRKAVRVIFKTGTHRPEAFEDNFSYFSAAAVEELGRAGVRLIGIDTPSIDARDSKDLSAHQMLVKLKMRNLENLDLASVTAGEYELVALPLKLEGFDASPVRAILISR